MKTNGCFWTFCLPLLLIAIATEKCSALNHSNHSDMIAIIVISHNLINSTLVIPNQDTKNIENFITTDDDRFPPFFPGGGGISSDSNFDNSAIPSTYLLSFFLNASLKKLRQERVRKTDILNLYDQAQNSQYKRPTHYTEYQPNRLIMLYPVYALESAASAKPSMIEREDVEFVGRSCCQCQEIFSEEDNVIYSSCQHLFHRACLLNLERCPSCDDSLSIENLALTESDSSSKAPMNEWFEVIAALDACMVASMPKIKSREQYWKNRITMIIVRRTLFNTMISDRLSQTEAPFQESEQFSIWASQIKQIIDDLCAGRIPEAFPDLSTAPNAELNELTSRFRSLFIDLNMHAIVDLAWTKILADKIGQGICLEVCAGRGWLAKALASRGVRITATDIAPEEPVTEVETVDAIKAIRAHPGIDYLILCWPPANSPLAAKCVRVLKPGVIIIYIGEPRKGCTGSDEFFDLVEEIDRMLIPRWYHYGDQVFFYRKK